MLRLALENRFRLMVIGAGALLVGLAIVWSFKLLTIRQLKSELVRWEVKLAQGQALWKDYPPLGSAEKSELEATRERLFLALPKDKDLPAVLEEVSRIAREHNLGNISFQAGDPPAPPTAQSAAPGANVPQVAPRPPASSPAAPSPKGSANGAPVGSFSFRMGFTGDYREIAHFLEALQRLPRLVTIQSVKLDRSVPQVAGEMILSAYYQKDELALVAP